MKIISYVCDRCGKKSGSAATATLNIDLFPVGAIDRVELWEKKALDLCDDCIVLYREFWRPTK